MRAVCLALLLSQIPGIGRQRLLGLLRHLQQGPPFSPDWEALNAWLQSHPGVPAFSSRAAFTNYLDRAKRTMEALQAIGAKATAFGEPEFPARLALIPDPPALLFYKGQGAALHAPRVGAVVGTRQPTGYGKASSLRIGRLLAEQGFVVVSGLALGCDAAAHEGCVEAGGPTVAVLAHGLHTVYPAANRGLAERILACGGCWASEYPPGSPPSRMQFVQRDRLQIGLADFLVLIESDARGGAMHTVRFCLEQSKPLGCLLHPDKYLTEAPTRGNQNLLSSGKAIAIADGSSLVDFVRSAIQAVSTNDNLDRN